MKRFVWPLQTLLDVTVHREQALREQLAKLAGQIARVRREIARREAILRQALADLAAADLQQRMLRQETVCRCARADEREIRRMEQALADLRRSRDEKMEQFRKTRNSRQQLERLREEALDRHRREALGAEQKLLDEAAGNRFVRKQPRPVGGRKE